MLLLANNCFCNGNVYCVHHGTTTIALRRRIERILVCIVLLLGGGWMTETHGQCTWVGMGQTRCPPQYTLQQGGDTVTLRSKISNLGVLSGDINGLLTNESLPATISVLFAFPSATDILREEEKVVLQDWLSAGNTLVLTGENGYKNNFNEWTSAVGDVQCTNKVAVSPLVASTKAGMDSEEPILENPIDVPSYHCNLDSNNGQVKELVDVNGLDNILIVADATTGLPYGGRVIYMGSRVFWADNIETRGTPPIDEKFLTDLVRVACSPPPALPGTEIFDRDWQIVLHPDEGVQSSINDSNGDLSVIQKFYSTGQEHVRFQVYEEDCVTPLPNNAISLDPAVQSDDSLETTVLTGQFDLDLTVLASLNTVWTGTATSGTARICTTIELLSEAETSETSESLFMLDTIISLTVDLVAEIATAQNMDVDAIGNAHEASSNAAVGQVQACHCKKSDHTCYTAVGGANPPALLSQGSFLHICLTFPEGFETGTIRSMDVSQPDRAQGTSVRIVDANGNVVRSGLTSVSNAQAGSSTDLVIKTMIPTEFFRYKKNEDRSTALPPATVTGEIVLGVGGGGRRYRRYDFLRHMNKKDRFHGVHTDITALSDGNTLTEFDHPEAVSDIKDVRTFTMQVNLDTVQEPALSSGNISIHSFHVAVMLIVLASSAINIMSVQ